MSNNNYCLLKPVVKMKSLIPVIIFSVLLFSCSKQDSQDISEGNSRISFRLTDAPALYDRVEIDLVGAVAIVDDSAIDLEVNAGIYNLLDFVNGKDTIIVDQEIPAGKLSQIRLILGDNNSVVVNNVANAMKTPSAQQSGLKLNIHEDFVPGIAYEYLIDFDAARSIVKTGNGKFILKPVIKVAAKSVSGLVVGVVLPAKAEPLIYAISAGLDSVSTKPDAVSGRYMFKGLSAGTYKLSFIPVEPYRDSTLTGIVVKTGVVTKIDTLKFK